MVLRPSLEFFGLRLSICYRVVLLLFSINMDYEAVIWINIPNVLYQKENWVFFLFLVAILLLQKYIEA